MSDWTCIQCAFSNYADEATCSECQAPKPTDVKSGESHAKLDKDFFELKETIDFFREHCLDFKGNTTTFLTHHMKVFLACQERYEAWKQERDEIYLKLRGTKSPECPGDAYFDRDRSGFEAFVELMTAYREEQQSRSRVMVNVFWDEENVPIGRADPSQVCDNIRAAIRAAIHLPPATQVRVFIVHIASKRPKPSLSMEKQKSLRMDGQAFFLDAVIDKHEQVDNEIARNIERIIQDTVPSKSIIALISGDSGFKDVFQKAKAEGFKFVVIMPQKAIAQSPQSRKFCELASKAITWESIVGREPQPEGPPGPPPPPPPPPPADLLEGKVKNWNGSYGFVAVPTPEGKKLHVFVHKSTIAWSVGQPQVLEVGEVVALRYQQNARGPSAVLVKRFGLRCDLSMLLQDSQTREAVKMIFNQLNSDEAEATCVVLVAKGKKELWLFGTSEQQKRAKARFGFSFEKALR